VAVAVHIRPKKMSHADYEKVIAELEKSGAGSPDGRLYHAGYGDDEVEMFEVWESKEHFDAHRDNLFAAIQGAGVDGGIVDVHQLHSER
jgi:quinol monooxygenase YgiN